MNVFEPRLQTKQSLDVGEVKQEQEGICTASTERNHCLEVLYAAYVPQLNLYLLSLHRYLLTVPS